MAILSSDGRFEITNISFSPKVIVFGEETSYSITIKNKSNVKITKLCIQLNYAYPTETHWSTTGYIDIFGELKTIGGFIEVVGSTNWANNTEKTFTGNVTFNPGSTPPYFEGRVVPEADRYGLSAFLYFNDDMSGFNHIDRNGVLYMVDAHYSPVISVFAAERSTGSEPNDEGENILADIALQCNAATRREYLSLYLNYRDRAKPEADPYGVNLTNLIDSALAGEIQTVIGETLNKNSDWDLVLWFGDQYESFALAVPISKSFANVHLSGLATGGVCFGGFDKSKPGDPRFRSYYPAEFVGGVEGVTNYVKDEVDTGGKWIDGNPIYRKVIVAKAGSSSEIAIIDTIADFVSLVRVYGAAHRASTNIWYSIPTYGSDSVWNDVYVMEDGVVRARSSFGSDATFYVVVEFTKPKP